MTTFSWAPLSGTTAWETPLAWGGSPAFTTSPGDDFVVGGSGTLFLTDISGGGTPDRVRTLSVDNPNATLSLSPGGSTFLIDRSLSLNAGQLDLTNDGGAILIGNPATGGGTLTLGTSGVISGGGGAGILHNGSPGVSTAITGSGTIIAASGQFVIGSFVTVSAGAAVDFQIGDAATLEFDDVIGGGTIDFKDTAGGGHLLLTAPLPTGRFGAGIEGLRSAGPHNFIDLQGGDVVTSASLLNITASGADLVINNSTTFSLAGDYQGASASFSDVGGGVTELSVACFLPGTRITTPGGDVLIENLTAGDWVTTVSGDPRRLIWIGNGRVMVARGRRSAATPVIVRRGALADNIPRHDLRITKGHSLFIDDVLIPVEFLINHRSICWDDVVQEVTVYHLELESHDVILANGAPAETYRDDGNRWMFQNADPGAVRHGIRPFAPVLTGGPVVDAVWRRLLDRDGRASRIPVTSDADVHLLVDGRRLNGRAAGPGRMIFDLPQVLADIRLRSRAAVPAELGLARDSRLLGVAIRRMATWRGPSVRMIEADHSGFISGFHAMEMSNGFRWTDGDASIPISLIQGARQLEVHFDSLPHYPIHGEEIAA